MKRFVIASTLALFAGVATAQPPADTGTVNNNARFSAPQLTVHHNAPSSPRDVRRQAHDRNAATITAPQFTFHRTVSDKGRDATNERHDTQHRDPAVPEIRITAPQFTVHRLQSGNAESNRVVNIDVPKLED